MEYITSRDSNPHNASKSVTAHANSGLWLSSLYSLALFSWRIFPNFLSGWACIDNALSIDKTFKRNGKSSWFNFSLRWSFNNTSGCNVNFAGPA